MSEVKLGGDVFIEHRDTAWLSGEICMLVVALKVLEEGTHSIPVATTTLLLRLGWFVRGG